MPVRKLPGAYRLPHLLGLLLAVLCPPALAEPAGQVIFAIGNVLAMDLQGNTRPLEKGAQVEEGDTLATNDGRAQIKFKDGGFVALQPQTRFLVERYRYAAAGDAEDGVVMSLIKGGLRTISGLVGKRDRAAYSMKTSVATIGIRGTDYALELGDKLVGNVAEGAIEVCNGAGCIGVLAGQAFLVPSLIDLPVLGERHVFLPPAAPQERNGRAEQSTDAIDDGDQGSERPTAEDRPGNGNANKDTIAKPTFTPSAADTTVGKPAGSGSSAGVAAAVGVGGNLGPTLAPGQAKKLDAAPSLSVLPAPAATLSGPPGQLKKLDAGTLDAVVPKPGNGVGPPGEIPPGQAKR
jgi:hypothetical protein